MAQARGDISAGYRFLRVEGLSYPAGWYVDATGHVHESISIVGDIGGNVQERFADYWQLHAEPGRQDSHFMGGAQGERVDEGSRRHRVRQGPVGAANLRSDDDRFGSHSFASLRRRPAFSLGGGVDVNGDLPIGVRGADWPGFEYSRKGAGRTRSTSASARRSTFIPLNLEAECDELAAHVIGVLLLCERDGARAGRAEVSVRWRHLYIAGANGQAGRMSRKARTPTSPCPSMAVVGRC